MSTFVQPRRHSPCPDAASLTAQRGAASMPATLALLLALLALPICSAAAVSAADTTATASPPMPSTEAERSGFVRTGRYEETIALCADFARLWPKRVRCIDFGTTPEGRPMKALIATDTGALTPQAARERGLPVVLVQGGIHAGEIDGKDAGFLALRELLRGEAAPGALDALVLLFVPVFNVDGHERFGAWNRPNQNGPEQMGWRTTAQNYNLNRDYAKADTPEMRAMLALVNAWDPVLTVDLHATDGAQFEHDIAIMVQPVHAGDEALRAHGKALRDGTIAMLESQGSLPLPFYPSFEDYVDPASGFYDSVSPPRFSAGYFWLRNRMAMLVETHSWKDYPTRVRITRNTVIDVLELAAREGARWRADADAADARAAALAGRPVALDYVTTDRKRVIDFRGYAYTRTPSEISGALMTRYDIATPQIWKVSLRDEIVPGRSVDAPLAGYLVPPAFAAQVRTALDVHGIAYRVVDKPLRQAATQSFRATSVTQAPNTVEGRQRTTVEGAWTPEPRDVGAGALFVPIAQAKSRLAMALLEPQAPDSLLAWGGFGNAFERKEYMEAYVAEEVARAMLDKDPALRVEFETTLREDAAFAADPNARLDFFYRRHSAWDERVNLYPVLRVDRAP